MDEVTWTTCDDHCALLRYIQAHASTRKLRLFLCGCCRVIWNRIEVENLRSAVELAERLADREALPVEAEYQMTQILQTLQAPDVERERHGLGRDQPASWQSGVFFHCKTTLHKDATLRGLGHLSVWSHSAYLTELNPSKVLRCVFGNPYRLVSLVEDWLTSTVIALARQMYDSRDFCPMPILADALQDAGCDNEEILQHCRGSGPHVRGCFLIDLLLGKV
jgi:hypothetical protein